VLAVTVPCPVAVADVEVVNTPGVAFEAMGNRKRRDRLSPALRLPNVQIIVSPDSQKLLKLDPSHDKPLGSLVDVSLKPLIGSGNSMFAVPPTSDVEPALETITVYPTGSPGVARP
jgi:hypothetical protein